MNNEYAAGVAVGILTALLILFIIRKLNKENKKGYYDERQELVRGRGYKYSMFTVIILLAVDMLGDEFGLFEILPVTHSTAACFIFMTGVMVYALYCIYNDAYLGIGANIKAYKITMWVVIIANLASLVSRIWAGELLENGKLSFSAATGIFFTIDFAIIMIALEIKSRREGKEETDEES